MTDKELIKQEIERRIKEGSSKNDILEGALALDSLLSFIDSLPKEPVSDDLNEAAKHYLYGAVLYDDVYVGNPTEEDCIRCFKAGAEWQRKKDQETIELAEDHAILAGMSKMKEEMMKDAIEGWCINDGHILNDIRTLETEKANLKIGDEVKIIIVKTEQK